jgi:hypothetical protein
MDTAIVGLAGTVQLIGLAIALIVAIVLGARVFGLGAKGFSSVIMEVAGLLVGIWIVARPNDVLGILLKAVGGVAAPTALH